MVVAGERRRGTESFFWQLVSEKKERMSSGSPSDPLTEKHLARARRVDGALKPDLVFRRDCLRKR